MSFFTAVRFTTSLGGAGITNIVLHTTREQGTALPAGLSHSDILSLLMQSIVQQAQTGDDEGVPPASAEAIAALPIVTLGAAELAHNPICTVCQEDFTEGESVMRLPCGHHFHKECATRWLESEHNTCPTCRLPIEEERQQRRQQEQEQEQEETAGDEGEAAAGAQGGGTARAGSSGGGAGRSRSNRIHIRPAVLSLRRRSASLAERASTERASMRARSASWPGSQASEPPRSAVVAATTASSSVAAAAEARASSPATAASSTSAVSSNSSSSSSSSAAATRPPPPRPKSRVKRKRNMPAQPKQPPSSPLAVGDANVEAAQETRRVRRRRA